MCVGRLVAIATHSQRQLDLRARGDPHLDIPSLYEVLRFATNLSSSDELVFGEGTCL